MRKPAVFEWVKQRKSFSTFDVGIITEIADGKIVVQMIKQVHERRSERIVRSIDAICEFELHDYPYALEPLRESISRFMFSKKDDLKAIDWALDCEDKTYFYIAWGRVHGKQKI